MADERDENSDEGAVQASEDTGGPEKADADADPTEGVKLVGDEGPALRFGPDDTGPLPHWTEPPTGEVPKVLADEGHEDVDPWSSFSSQAPVWRDDQSEEGNADLTPLTADLPPVETGGGLFESVPSGPPAERRPIT